MFRDQTHEDFLQSLRSASRSFNHRVGFDGSQGQDMMQNLLVQVLGMLSSPAPLILVLLLFCRRRPCVTLTPTRSRVRRLTAPKNAGIFFVIAACRHPPRSSGNSGKSSSGCSSSSGRRRRRKRKSNSTSSSSSSSLGPTGICPTSTSRHRRRRRALWWMSCRCRRLCCCCCCSRGTSFLQPRQKEEGSSGGDHHPPSPSSNPDSHKLPNLRFKPWPRHHLAWPVWKRRRVALKQSAAPVGVPPDTSCVGRDEFLYLGVCKVGGGVLT